MTVKQEVRDGLARSQERLAMKYREQFQQEQLARIKAEREKRKNGKQGPERSVTH